MSGGSALWLMGGCYDHFHLSFSHHDYVDRKMSDDGNEPAAKRARVDDDDVESLSMQKMDLSNNSWLMTAMMRMAMLLLPQEELSHLRLPLQLPLLP